MELCGEGGRLQGGRGAVCVMHWASRGRDDRGGTHAGFMRMQGRCQEPFQRLFEAYGPVSEGQGAVRGPGGETYEVWRRIGCCLETSCFFFDIDVCSLFV